MEVSDFEQTRLIQCALSHWLLNWVIETWGSGESRGVARVPYPMPYFQTKMRPVGPKKIGGTSLPLLSQGLGDQVPPTPLIRHWLEVTVEFVFVAPNFCFPRKHIFKLFFAWSFNDNKVHFNKCVDRNSIKCCAFFFHGFYFINGIFLMRKN